MSLIIIIISAMLISCSGDAKEKLINDTDSRLELTGKYKLSIREPSGLTLSSDGEFLWTVSDEYSSLYKITKKGQLVDSVEISGADLEGIEIFGNNFFCIVTERDRGILLYTPEFKLKKRVLLDISGEENSGIEGIAHNPVTGVTYILNEKNPGLLIEINDKFDIVKKKKLNFAKDYSGLEIDTSKNHLWIISDESQLLFKCDLDGSPIDSFKVDIPQIEGIAIDFHENLIYLVSDKTEMLYVFRLTE
jgi:uncharacterized protein YjiK